MKLGKLEKLLLAIAITLALITGAIFAAEAIFSKPSQPETSASFNFQRPADEGGEPSSSKPASPDPDQTEPGPNQTETVSQVPEPDPRLGLERIPGQESDLDRIKRLIAPESPGDIEKNYMIRVFKDRQLVTVFEDPKGDGSFDYLIKAFNCSSAADGHNTPSGQHKIGLKLYSGYMIDASYGQYCSEFLQYHYFHAVPSYGGVEEAGVSWEDYNKLGQAASHGCIRLETKAAKWIYDYCKEATPVEILDSSEDFPYLPDKVDQLKMSPDGPKWDPTNPNPLNPYQQDPSLLLDYNHQG
ncbi:MAG: L,D-transpeptidase [Eubacteriales bacterium]|nr:L,D-transpeptidase [Clostridiales bacterium]MDY5836869.1 L,D-transpeptidase [Eubacteriales bacterium]